MQRRTLLKIALSSVAVAATPGWATESTSQVTLYKDPQLRLLPSLCGLSARQWFYGDGGRNPPFAAHVRATQRA